MKGEETPHEPLPESRFIGNDERCPHPEFWHSTDGDSTELEVSEMIAGLVRGLQPEVVVETGAAFGQTTRMIAEALQRNGHGQLVAFEIDPERFEALRSIPWRVPVLLYRNSLGGVPPFPGTIDLAFFDSWPEFRVQEFHRFRPQMRAGTIVAFHDTRPGAGAHRIIGGLSLREALEVTSGRTLSRSSAYSGMKLLDMPTPRGLTLGQVL